MFRPQLLWPKHVVDKLYTVDNIVVLRLLYPYRIISLCFNSTTGMPSDCSVKILECPGGANKEAVIFPVYSSSVIKSS